MMFLMGFVACSAPQKEDLNGAWYILPRDKFDKSILKHEDFGWGRGYTIPNGSMDVDLIKKTIYIPGLFSMEIVEVKKISDDTYEIVTFFSNGGFNVSYIIHFIDKDRIWVDYKGEGSLYSEIGKENIYYRLDVED
jgi:hypothetical protein